MTWANRYSWFAGLGIIILTNVIALAGVAYNRSGEPDTSITLSERELHLPWSWSVKRENSGLSLRLQWRVNGDIDDRYYYRSRRSNPSWLNEEKLAGLGFPVKRATETDENRRRLGRSLPREVFLVLEYNGPAYQDMLARGQAYLNKQQALAAKNLDDKKIVTKAEKAEKHWEHAQQEASRLFVVDAGLDPGALRSRYPDASRNIIMRGNIQARVVGLDDDQWEVQGFIRNVAVSKINIPLEFRSIFDPFMEEDYSDSNKEARYKVTLIYGKRYEPWVMNVERSVLNKHHKGSS